MNIILTLLLGALVPWFLVPAAQAQGFDLNALQKQMAANPAMQQMQQQMMQQALLEASKNPQMIAQMANALSPQQQATLMQQAMAMGQKMFTPAEQAKLAEFTSSPEGASIAAKLPQMAQQLAPVVLQMYAASMAPAAKVVPAAGK